MSNTLVIFNYPSKNHYSYIWLYKTIGLIYALFSLLTILSVYFQIKIIGLYQYELYFVGCLLDILMFSSALGYRSHLNNLEKIKTQEALKEQSMKNEQLLIQQQILLEKENKQNQALIDLNGNIQRELGARLSSIHLYTELASKTIEKDTIKTNEYLEKATDLSTRLMSEMGDILWVASSSDNISAEEVKARIHNIAQENLSNLNIKYLVSFTEAFNQSKLNKNQISDLLQSFKNKINGLIDNSIKHIIEVDVINGDVKVEVR